MYCPYCGYDQEDNSAFCGNCGKHLAENGDELENPGAEAGSTHQSKTKVLKTVICIVIPAIVLISSAFVIKTFLKSHKDSERSISGGFVSRSDGQNILHFSAPDEKNSTPLGELAMIVRSTSAPVAPFEASTMRATDITSASAVHRIDSTTRRQITEPPAAHTVGTTKRNNDIITSRYVVTTRIYEASTSEPYIPYDTSTYYWEDSNLCINTYDVWISGDNQLSMSWDVSSNHLISDWLVLYYYEGEDEDYWLVRCADECKNMYYGFSESCYNVDTTGVCPGDVFHFFFVAEDVSGAQVVEERVIEF